MNGSDGSMAQSIELDLPVLGDRLGLVLVAENRLQFQHAAKPLRTDIEELSTDLNCVYTEQTPHVLRKMPKCLACAIWNVKAPRIETSVLVVSSPSNKADLEQTPITIRQLITTVTLSIAWCASSKLRPLRLILRLWYLQRSWVSESNEATPSTRSSKRA